MLVPWWVRQFPADLTAAVLGVIVANMVVFTPVVREAQLQVVLALPPMLFVPGYVLLAALFPEAGEQSSTAPATDGNGTETRQGIDGIERVVLSFGLSIAVVPLIVLTLNFTPWGIRLVPIMIGLTGAVFGATAVAAHRRFALPADEQFRVPYQSWLATARTAVFDPGSRADAGLNVLLGVAVLLAASSVAYAVAVPPDGERFTEFYVLSENESSDLVAGGYPTEFERGESEPVVLGIGNQEHEPVNYTVVAALHRVSVDGAEGPTDPTANATNVTVTDRQELDRLSASVAHNETWLETYEVEPTTTEGPLRLTFLLYRGDPPAQPTVDTAYRDLHLWVTVTERH